MSILSLPQETPERIRFFNDIFGVNRCPEFSIGEMACQLRFDPGAAPAHPVCSFQITGTESGDLRILLSDTSIFTELQPWLGDARLEDVPDEIAALVLDSWLADTFTIIESQLGESFHVSEFCRKEPPEPLADTLPFWLSGGTGQRVRGLLQFEAGWRATIHSLISLTPSAVSLPVDDLSVSAPIELGRSTLTVGELRTLQPCDVVMLEQSHYLSDQLVTVVLPGQLRATCAVEESTVIVTDIGDGNPSSSDSAAAPVEAQDLRLPVSVQAGFVPLTLGEVRHAAPGDEWMVTVDETQAVDFLLVGSVIGHGELIRNGDRLGIRLLRLTEGPMAQLLQTSAVTTCRQSSVPGG